MTENQETHVIFGAGPAGAATARHLVKAGKIVRLVNRSGQRTEFMPAEAEVVAADVTDPVQARQAAAGANVIYFCLNAPYAHWPTLFPPLQAGVLQAASDLQVPIVALENVYMYGQVSGTMTEATPYLATTRKGKLRAQMSRELLAAHENGQVKVAIGRASDFYGPKVDSTFGSRLWAGVLSGKGAELVGNPDMPHTYTYIDDVGFGLAMLGQNTTQSTGEIWHLPNAPAKSARQMVNMIYQKLDQSPKYQVMGRMMMMIGGLFIPEARESLEMMYQTEKPFVVDSSKFFGKFGDYYTPIETGLTETTHYYTKATVPQT